MGWTFKTEEEKVIELTNYPEEHNPEKDIYYSEDIDYDTCGDNHTHPDTGEELIRITVQEANKIRGVKLFDMDLRGRGFPDKDRQIKERREKALQKDPSHTTMKDYKMSNPDSIPAKAREKNRLRMKKKGVPIKRNNG